MRDSVSGKLVSVGGAKDEISLELGGDDLTMQCDQRVFRHVDEFDLLDR